MSKYMQDRSEQWREIEASLGGRYHDGKECPRHAELYRLAESQAARKPDPPEAGTLRQHLALCSVCRSTYEIAVEAAEDEFSGVRSEVGPDLALLPEELRGPAGASFPSAADAFSGVDEQSLADAVAHATDESDAVVAEIGTYRGPSLLTRLRQQVPKLSCAAAALVLVAVIVSMGAANAKQRATIRELLARLDRLEREIADSGLLGAAVVDQIRVANRTQLEVAGRYNPSFIKEVRVRWGTEQGDSWTSLYKGGEQPDPEGRNLAFSQTSPEYTLNGDSIAVTLEFEPYPEISKRFPHFFRADQLQFSRNFLLAEDGIKADPHLVEILEPQDGAKVERSDTVAGRFNVKEGWPVVLVKPLISAEAWWVEPLPVDSVVGGQFTASAYFGSDDTPPGTRFRVVVVLAKSKGAAGKFEPGMTLKTLPAGLPRSNPITVVRQ